MSVRCTYDRRLVVGVTTVFLAFFLKTLYDAPFSTTIDLSQCPRTPTSPSSSAGSAAWADVAVSTASQGKLWHPTPLRRYVGLRRFSRHAPSSNSRPVLRQTFRKCRLWAVVTTIFPPSTLMQQLRALDRWCVVVVGDRRTDDEIWAAFARGGNRTVYLSAEAQKLLNYSILQHLPWDHFGRKNVGYLYALHHGARQIWDTDDDNILIKVKRLSKLAKLARSDKQVVPLAHADHHLWNPYPPFMPIEPHRARDVEVCWPRGFPLEYVKDEASAGANFSASVLAGRMGVIQSLANRDPDVDAVYRLTKHTPLSFGDANLTAVLPLGRVAPFNAQATLWARDAFWGMLLPVSVHGRVSDIWRAFFTQRIMREVGLHLGFTGPLVEQLRNEHSLMADLQAEVPLYTQANELIKWLRTWEPKGKGAEGVAQMVEEMYVSLYEIGILEEKDVQLQQAWLEDLEAIGYVMPEVKTLSQASPDLRVETAKSAREPDTAGSKANVAVCVSGQVRTLDTKVSDEDHPKTWSGIVSSLPAPNMTVAESIQRNLYPKLGNPDVFMVVATKETEREPKVGDLSVCESLRPKGGHLTCEVLREDPIHVFNMDMWEKLHIYKLGEKDNPGQNAFMIDGLLQQLKGMYDCHQTIHKHSLKTGKKYDWMVRLRPDDYIYSFPELDTLALAATKPTVWFGSFKVSCCGNEDRFGIGRADWMQRYFDRFLYIQQMKWDYRDDFSAEEFLDRYLGMFNISLRPHPEIKLSVVKPRHRTNRSQP